MHRITFYPLGNADTCLVELEGGAKLLFDYANVAASGDEEDSRIDLEEALRKNLEEAGCDYFDVVAFTHLDDDHIHGASEFFHLEHADKYQGEGRVKIKTLYVPAAAIIEQSCEGEVRIVRAEARHRLREGKGIRVFSRPKQLEKWLEDQDLRLEDREHLITDAGQLIPQFSLEEHGVEFFVHSPFASRLEDGCLIDRNIDALAVQATFGEGGTQTRLFMSSDLEHEAFTDIVNISRYHDNEDRLEWEVFKTPHHCSYLSLSPEKGKETTNPVADVKWLFEEQAGDRPLIVSTSKPIPADDSDDQPPHHQAANYYKKVVGSVDGEFLVTMEHPEESAPEPLVIQIDDLGATVKKTIESAAIRATSSTAPRAG